MTSGDTLAVFTAWDGMPPVSNYGTVDTRNVHRVADFDAATDETLLYEGVLPRNYAGGGVTLRMGWMASSATSGNCVWNASFERHQDETDDLDSDTFASAQAATGAAPATSGMVQYTDITFTNGAQMDSLAVGESYRLRITRNAASGSDTMTGDAELLRLELRET